MLKTFGASDNILAETVNEINEQAILFRENLVYESIKETQKFNRVVVDKHAISIAVRRHKQMASRIPVLVSTLEQKKKLDQGTKMNIPKK